jgi:hypothetical protein
MHPRIGVIIFSVVSAGILAAAIAVGAVLAHLAALAAWLYGLTCAIVFFSITVGQTDYSAGLARRRAPQGQRDGVP